jgi:hypothetical protein
MDTDYHSMPGNHQNMYGDEQTEQLLDQLDHQDAECLPLLRSSIKLNVCMYRSPR